jgi:uncharacterized protein (DUF736 family)
LKGTEQVAFEQKELNGALFRNDKKEKPSHPDYRGDCKIDGVDYRISGWIKESKNGGKFMSLSFTLKDGQGGRDSEPF